MLLMFISIQNDKIKKPNCDVSEKNVFLAFPDWFKIANCHRNAEVVGFRISR